MKLKKLTNCYDSVDGSFVIHIGHLSVSKDG